MNALTTTSRAASLAQVAPLTDWSQAAQDWINNLSSERTQAAYLEAWRGFLGFILKTPGDIVQGDVIAYRRHLKTSTSPTTGRPYSQSTINQRLSAISSFFEFAKGRELRTDNPAEGVNREAVKPYGKATWLSPKRNEDRLFLASIDTTTTQGKRDRAIMLLFLTQALRVAEVAGLKVGDLRKQGRATYLTYKRKGGEVEEVPVAQEAAEAIAAYLATRSELTPASPLFVATEKGRRAAEAIGRYGKEEKPLTDRAIRYVVRTYAKAALGAGHRIHPHSLRHTAAHVAQEEGRGFTEISRLLKHKSGMITTIYLQSTSDADEETAEVMGRRYNN